MICLQCSLAKQLDYVAVWSNKAHCGSQRIQQTFHILVNSDVLPYPLPHIHVLCMHNSETAPLHSHAHIEIQGNRWAYVFVLLTCTLHKCKLINKHCFELVRTSHCDSSVVILTALHKARLDNYSWDGKREQLPTENPNSSSSFLTYLRYLSILSVSLHLLFISVPLSTSVFLPASSSVSVSRHSGFTTKATFWQFFCHFGCPAHLSHSAFSLLLLLASLSFHHSLFRQLLSLVLISSFFHSLFPFFQKFELEVKSRRQGEKKYEQIDVKERPILYIVNMHLPLLDSSY